MAENSAIEWTHHTFNPWEGCAHVSPGCAHCYAETRANRFGSAVWGPHGTRRIASENYWRQPLAWDRKAAATGEHHRVFCASLADVFEDRPDLLEPRARLLGLIFDTPNLDWLLLTKRPATWAKVMRETIDTGKLRISEAKRGGKHWQAVDWLHGKPPRNVWLGVSVEDQQRADERIPLLLQTPAAVRFLSCEPLLGPVGLRRWFDPKLGISGEVEGGGFMVAPRLKYAPPLHWVIVGGESGPGARPCDVAWVRSIVAQCRAAGVACFVKQLGRNVRWSPAFGAAGEWPAHVRFDYERRGEASEHRIVLRHDKGGDLTEWPADLRVREFPAAEARP